ncbi:hypothetical protein BYT27DRAFT_6655343 [Phlegmacium glaucopus]|nr:hypothetical protein BYT27DRAFT_6655343 [Phlegmacium glaucopus]
MSSPPPDAVLATALVHLHAGLYFQIAGFVMLIYDHMLTFSDEVERIWKQKITGASILFLMNRYLTPLQFIIVIDAFQDPEWTKKACDRFVVFEGAQTISMVGICELIMILRVYALYGRSKLVAIPLLLLLAAQIVLSSLGVNTGFAVPLPPGVVGCILTGTSSLLALIWVTPLVTDSLIFFLTLWKTGQYIKKSGRSPTLDIFLRDGAMYFCVIFASNLLNTLIYFVSPIACSAPLALLLILQCLLFKLATEDLKAIGASFSQLMTSVMISRIVLNLRSVSESRSLSASRGAVGLIEYHQIRQFDDNSLLTMVIGNLGEDFKDNDS